MENNVSGKTLMDIGFHCIHIEVAQNATIKKGASVKCNATFAVTDGVLYISSEYDGVTLIIPQVSFETIEIDTKYGSVTCDGLSCNQLSISSAQSVKVENSSVNVCEISSTYDAVHVSKSTIETLNIRAAQNVSIELDDFCYIEITSEYDSVKVKYNGNRLVNVNCSTTFGSVEAKGTFYGNTDCDKKIVISAAQNIKLLSK